MGRYRAILVLQRHILPGSLLYGFGVFIVMSFIVLPLSAVLTLPAPLFIEIILEHILFVGLRLGLPVLWDANINS